nr:unnamed protein product [Callosobruchus chinensis]
MACKWFSQSPKKIEKIQLVFPVTGHSFLPADRVFAQIEKKIRKQDTITDPTDYIDIFRAHGTVKKIGKDWSLLDWRSAIKDVMKPTNGLHFQLLACKRFILTKQNTKNILVQGELNYKSETGVAKSIFRRGKTVHMLSPQPLEVGKRPIKKLKKDNVDELLSKHFGADWQSKSEEYNLRFYQEVLAATTDDNDGLDDENDVCEPNPQDANKTNNFI